VPERLGGTGLESRSRYSNRCEYMLTLVGYSVGFGNIWRFPYLTYANGGGAFLIPYFIALFALGLPLFILELGLGQMYRQGCLGVWHKMGLRRMQGVGIAATICTFLFSLYYIVILGWTLFLSGQDTWSCILRCLALVRCSRRFYMSSKRTPFAWIGCSRATGHQQSYRAIQCLVCFKLLVPNKQSGKPCCRTPRFRHQNRGSTVMSCASSSMVLGVPGVDEKFWNGRAGGYALGLGCFIHCCLACCILFNI